MNILNENELKKANIIKGIVAKEVTKLDAKKELELSRRQIDRLIKKYLKEGDDAFIHKNKGKKSNKKISTETVEKIVNLYIKEYYDYNFTHFYEETSDQLGVSFVTVCNVLNEADIISPEAQHKTIKLYNEKMKKSICEETASDKEIELFKIRQQHEKEKHFRRSENLYAFGEEVQMDAAVCEWFGNEITFLHLAVDRGTKKVLYVFFDYQETAHAYYIVLMNIITTYGIPSCIRTDKRGCFNVNNSRYQKTKADLTRFGEICEELKIDLKCSSNPVFKPNVERENKTFKGRLKAELRKNNISTIEEANVYLNEIFIPKMNEKLSYKINQNRNQMKENIYSEEELNIMFSEKETRLIDNASSFKYNNYYYMPINLDTDEVESYAQKTEVEVIIAFDKTILCSINDIIYGTVKLEKRNQKDNDTDKKKTQQEINNSRAHKPASNHPWRKSMIRK